jgi:hypothetical protein
VISILDIAIGGASIATFNVTVVALLAAFHLAVSWDRSTTIRRRGTSAVAREAVLDLAVKITSIARGCVAIIARLLAHFLAITTDFDRIQRTSSTGCVACVTSLHLARAATAITVAGVAIITALAIIERAITAWLFGVGLVGDICFITSTTGDVFSDTERLNLTDVVFCRPVGNKNHSHGKHKHELC